MPRSCGSEPHIKQGSRGNVFKMPLTKEIPQHQRLKYLSPPAPWEQRVIGISGSLIWSKTLMGLIFNLYGMVNFGEVLRDQL